MNFVDVSCVGVSERKIDGVKMSKSFLQFRCTLSVSNSTHLIIATLMARVMEKGEENGKRV